MNSDKALVIIVPEVGPIYKVIGFEQITLDDLRQVTKLLATLTELKEKEQKK